MTNIQPTFKRSASIQRQMPDATWHDKYPIHSTRNGLLQRVVFHAPNVARHISNLTCQ